MIRLFPLVLALMFILTGCGGALLPRPTIERDSTPIATKEAPAAKAAPGFSPYGIFHPKWDCDAMMSAIEKLDTYRFSALYNTFGKSFGCFGRLAGHKKTNVIEVALINEVCMRNKRCEKHEFGSGMTPAQYDSLLRKKDSKLLAKLKVYSAQAARDLRPRMNPDAYCFINPGLESNLSVSAAKVLIDTVRPYFPGCHMVWNPLRGPPIAGTLHELHHRDAELAQYCVYNNDGDVLAPSEFPAQREKYAHCSLAAFWQLCDNGNKGVHSFIPPTKRTAFCNSTDFKAMVSALTGKYEKPSVKDFDKRDLAKCRSKQKAPDGAKKGFLFKTSDTKQCKHGKCAVALFPGSIRKQFRKVELWARGKVVEKFSFVYFSDEHKDPGGARQTWKSQNKTPAELPFYSILNADGQCWPLKNPRERID